MWQRSRKGEDEEAAAFFVQIHSAHRVSSELKSLLLGLGQAIVQSEAGG